MKPFRQNVCAVIVNTDRTRVLVFKRDDAMFKRPWQFPQGGLDPDETPEQGLLRELKEETGIDDVDVLQRVPRPIRYVYPPGVVKRLVADGSKLARFRGQEQYWFLVQLRGSTDVIHFNYEPREFNAFRWVTPRQAIGLVVAFKREAYTRGLTGLKILKLRPVARRKPHTTPAKRPTAKRKDR